MVNLLKTLALFPIVFVVSTIIYLVTFAVIMLAFAAISVSLVIGYFVGALMLPTKLYNYVKFRTWKNG